MCGFHTITFLPHSMFCISPAIVISSDMDEKQSVYSLKSLRERTFLCARIFEAERPRKTL